MQKLTLFLLILFAAFGPLTARADVDINRPLDLNFTAVDGRKVDLAQLRGKVVLLDFWATWCPGCRQEVPEVVNTYRKYHDKGFEVVGISLDQDKDALQAFTSEHGMTWPQYYDGQGWTNNLAVKYGVESIPFTVLVGPDGKIIDKDLRGDDLESAVAKALSAK